MTEVTGFLPAFPLGDDTDAVERSTCMSDKWRELATLVGVTALAPENAQACPLSINTENGDAFDVAEVLLAFGGYIDRRLSQ